MLLRLAAAVLQVVVATSGGVVDPGMIEPQADCSTYLWTCTTTAEAEEALFLRVQFEGPGLFPPGIDAVVFLHDAEGNRIASEVCTNFELAAPPSGDGVGCVFPLSEPVSGPVELSLDVWGTYAGEVSAELR